jgi:hypothetical protein
LRKLEEVFRCGGRDAVDTRFFFLVFNVMLRHDRRIRILWRRRAQGTITPVNLVFDFV